MAPAIRYLSADNHTAATPTVKLVNTEPPPPYFRVTFQVRFTIVYVCESLNIFKHMLIFRFRPLNTKSIKS